MAALCGVVKHYIKFPGCDEVPAGLCCDICSGAYSFVALYLLSTVMELVILAAQGEEGGRQLRRPSRLWPVYRRQRNKELCKGRLAMFVTSGLVAADLLTSKDGMQQLGKDGTQQIVLGTVRQRGSRVAS